MNRKGTAKNLNPFKPGESGNPNGRPKKLPGLDELLVECLGEDGNEAKAILKAIIKKAKQGDVRAAEMILDRYYGKPNFSIEHSEKRELPVITGMQIFPASEIDYSLLSESARREVLNATK